MKKGVLNKFILLGGVMTLLPMSVAAQGLTLTPAQSSYNPDYTTIALIALRVVLVLITVITGMVALKAGQYWLFSEGNAKKAYENKRQLAFSLLIITIMFFSMVMYRVFIPDYSVLAL